MPRVPGGPTEHTKLISGVYDSIYAPNAQTIAQIEATRIVRRRVREPMKDRSAEEQRQCWREDAADRKALLRALGLPTKGRLTTAQKRRVKIERERLTTLAKVQRETPEFLERQRQLHREQQKRWAASNPEKIAEAQRRWKAKNPDYHGQASRDAYAANPEQKKARARAYYHVNRERILAKRRATRAGGCSDRPPNRRSDAQSK